MLSVPEHTGYEFRAHFTTVDERPTIPATVHWRLYNVTAEEIVQEWTVLTPIEIYDEVGTVIDVYAQVEVPASLHVLNDTSAKREDFQLLIVTGKDTDRELSIDPDFIYCVRRQKGRD